MHACSKSELRTGNQHNKRPVGDAHCHMRTRIMLFEPFIAAKDTRSTFLLLNISAVCFYCSANPFIYFFKHNLRESNATSMSVLWLSRLGRFGGFARWRINLYLIFFNRPGVISSVSGIYWIRFCICPGSDFIQLLKSRKYC